MAMFYPIRRAKNISLQRDWFKFSKLRLFVAKAGCHRILERKCNVKQEVAKIAEAAWPFTFRCQLIQFYYEQVLRQFGQIGTIVT